MTLWYVRNYYFVLEKIYVIYYLQEMTWSTLHSAAYTGDSDTVKFLLSKGAKYTYKVIIAIADCQ